MPRPGWYESFKQDPRPGSGWRENFREDPSPGQGWYEDFKEDPIPGPGWFVQKLIPDQQLFISRLCHQAEKRGVAWSLYSTLAIDNQQS